MPVLGKARQKGRSVACSSHMRQVAMASQMYVQDFEGFFAKSSHSAALNRCLRWGPAFSPYLGAGRYKDPNNPSWKNLFSKFYRCPSDKRTNNTWSYGKNVWFELSALEISFATGTASGPYHTLMQVRHPAAVIEFGEMIDTSIATMAGSSVVDHFMAQYWVADSFGIDPAEEVDKKRHGNRANYSYLDGHILSQEFKETFDISNPNRRVDNWNPGTAK